LARSAARFRGMPRSALLIVATLLLSVLGCARETPGARAPRPGFRPWVAAPGYSWPPRVKQDRMNPGPRAIALAKTDPITTAQRPPLPSDSLLPGGPACLERLAERGVRFSEAPAVRGVETPIVLGGPIGGVEFWSPAGPMVVDCRFALGLEQVVGEFAAVGVRRVRFSGAYVFRTSKKGRLSLHAYGLALDVHDVTTDQGTFSVRRDFARGLLGGCGDDFPVLNRLACRLRQRGLFRELLTPDYDADHHDHLHLGVAPLPGSSLPGLAAAPSKAERTPKQGLRKGRAQVKAAGQRAEHSPVRVRAATSSARVTRLRPNLEKAPEVTRDEVETASPNEAGELLPVEAERGELVGARAPE